MASNSSLQLKAAAPTDFWRKPPNRDVATAPTELRTLSSTDFHRARVTLSAPWTRLYDQGGLFVYLPAPASTARTARAKRPWVKTGIELYDARAHLSTVAAREWADWSLLPLARDTVTVELAREPVCAAEGTGSSAWVYLIERAGAEETRVAVREITWAFEAEGEMSVGVYAARPTQADDDEAGEELVVSFENLVVE